MEEFINIGQIRGAHGVHGELKVRPLTDFPSRFNNLDHLFLVTDHYFQKYTIERVRIHQDMILLKLNEIDNRKDAEALQGAFCQIDKALRLPLPENRFYIDDLIGCSIYENNNYIGKITEVLQPGANDVYQVKRNEKTDLLIPALKSVVKNIDIVEKRIDVVLPEGLE